MNEGLLITIMAFVIVLGMAKLDSTLCRILAELRKGKP